MTPEEIKKLVGPVKAAFDSFLHCAPEQTTEKGQRYEDIAVKYAPQLADALLDAAETGLQAQARVKELEGLLRSMGNSMAGTAAFGDIGTQLLALLDQPPADAQGVQSDG
jgi:hypothetical protein